MGGATFTGNGSSRVGDNSREEHPAQQHYDAGPRGSIRVVCHESIDQQ
jgi:hypothetical protein